VLAEACATPAQTCQVAFAENRLAVQGQDGFKQPQAQHHSAICRGCRQIASRQPLAIAPEWVHAAAIVAGPPDL